MVIPNTQTTMNILQQRIDIAEALLASYREHMTAAVTVGEIDEGTALYVGDILQDIIRHNTK